MHVFLLDREMKMDKIGLISSNLAERIAMTVTESPYCVAAETISEACGDHQRARRMEPDIASWRKDQRGGKAGCLQDGCRLKHGNERPAGDV